MRITPKDVPERVKKAVSRAIAALEASTSWPPIDESLDIDPAPKIKFRKWQVETLLNQAADLLDRCIRDRALYDDLRAKWCLLSLERATARVTLAGGYVLPGDTPGPGQTPLPSDLEQAAVEQVAYWFQTQDKLGLLRHWPHEGTYLQLSGADLLPAVAAVLQKYKRWAI